MIPDTAAAREALAAAEPDSILTSRPMAALKPPSRVC